MDYIAEMIPDYYDEGKELPPFDELFINNPSFKKNFYWYNDDSIDWYNKVNIQKRTLNLEDEIILKPKNRLDQKK